MKIGFIGTGIMGSSMVKNLLKDDYEVIVYNRSIEKARDLVEFGAILSTNIEELVVNSDVIISIVGFPKDVEEIYLGKYGIIENIKKGQIAIDMTTSSPKLAIEISKKALKNGVYTLDAPVSGGDIGAKNGTLSIMVGGDRGTFDKIYPIFESMGKNIVWQGGPGSGQHTKMANQIAIASGMIGISESLYYTYKSGLDPEKVLKSISEGAAGSWSLSNLTPRVIAGDLEPGFMIKHFLKDLKIALDESRAMGIKLEGLELAYSMYSELLDAGYAKRGTQALIKYYQ